MSLRQDEPEHRSVSYCNKMTDALYNSIETMEPHVALILVSMIPFIELRGGIIVGTALGLNWTTVLWFCIIGNIIPIPFVILFGRFMLNWLGKTRLFGGLVQRYKKKVMRKSDMIQKYGPWGLAIFVGIPLPGTGAWSGSVLALLMDLRLKSAIPAILAGVVLSGIIMTIGSQGVAGLLQLL